MEMRIESVLRAAVFLSLAAFLTVKVIESVIRLREQRISTSIEKVSVMDSQH